MLTNANHRSPFTLPYGHKTTAHWAHNPAGKAIIFVHGFGGKAVTTWTSFSSMLLQEPLCSGHDIIFLGYDGLYAQAEVSAIILHNFLDSLFRNPLSVINSIPERQIRDDKDFKYTEITLIAHSLGAIISRRAQLIAHKQGNLWVDNTKMVLFAPAHMGAHITELISLIPWPLRLPYGVGEAKFQAIKDLKPGCDTLNNLLEDTKKVINSGKGSFAIAKKVIWPERDNIVLQREFASDPLAKPYVGRTHTDVCKPNIGFTDPVKDVIEVIK